MLFELSITDDLFYVCREMCGLKKANSFSELKDDIEETVRNRLSFAYEYVYHL